MELWCSSRCINRIYRYFECLHVNVAVHSDAARHLQWCCMLAIIFHDIWFWKVPSGKVALYIHCIGWQSCLYLLEVLNQSWWGHIIDNIKGDYIIVLTYVAEPILARITCPCNKSRIACRINIWNIIMTWERNLTIATARRPEQFIVIVGRIAVHFVRPPNFLVAVIHTCNHQSVSWQCRIPLARLTILKKEELSFVWCVHHITSVADVNCRECIAAKW